MRGSPRSFAHRPFPSMMMATCRGIAFVAIALQDDGFGASGADADDRQFRAGQLRDALKIITRTCRQLLEGFRATGRLVPAGHLFINRRARGPLRRVAWRNVDAFAVAAVRYTNFDPL